MRTKAGWLSRIVVMVALGLTFASTPLAQTTSTAINVRNFEVISVDGNKLVVRDERGTQELTVPDDFRFTVDGKQMSVSDLKAGMKGTATVTTTTTVRPVFVTEMREGEVMRASDVSITVRRATTTRRYTRGELDERGIQIYKDGKPVRIGDLKKGDKLTATIITSGPPAVLTQQEVQATLAESTPEPAPTKAAEPAPTKAAEPEPTKVATAAVPAQPAPAASPQPSAPQPASQPAESSGMSMTTWL